MIDLLLILSFVLEPLLWYKSASAKFSVKCKKVVQVFILLDLADSFLGKYTSLQEYTGQAFHSVLFFTYITLFICQAFEGRLIDKLKHTGTMFLIYLASDIISMLMLSMFANIEQISGDGIWNVSGALLSKIIMFVLIQLVVKKSVVVSREMLPFVFMLVLMEIPLVVLFKDSSSSSVLNIVMCSSVQVFAIYMVYLVKRLLDRKNLVITSVKSESERIEAELESKTILLNATVVELEEIKKLESKPGTHEESGTLEFFENRKKIHINPDNILYVERCDRKIVIVEQDGQRHEINSSIAKMMDLLGEQFGKINQGIIVNKNSIVSAESDCVKLKGDIILYASRRMLKEGELV